MEYQCIVVIGSLTAGFTHHGPFPSNESAWQWIKSQHASGEAEIIKLYPPVIESKG